MKKLIFKFWLIHVLISIALFVAYRFVIASKVSTDKNVFEFLLNILEILLDLGFSLIYLAGMLACSLPFFLNLFVKIRKNFFFSLFTFLGIPSICLIYFIVVLSIDHHSNHVLTTFVIFSMIYLFLTAIEFLIFRKRVLQSVE